MGRRISPPDPCSSSWDYLEQGQTQAAAVAECRTVATVPSHYHSSAVQRHDFGAILSAADFVEHYLSAWIQEEAAELVAAAVDTMAHYVALVEEVDAAMAVTALLAESSFESFARATSLPQ